MTKAELIAKLSEKTGASKADADKCLKAFTEVLVEALEDGDKVALAGLGTFSVSDRAARKGHNPATGEEIDIPAKKAVSFKAASALKDALNK